MATSREFKISLGLIAVAAVAWVIGFTWTMVTSNPAPAVIALWVTAALGMTATIYYNIKSGGMSNG